MTGGGGVRPAGGERKEGGWYEPVRGFPGADKGHGKPGGSGSATAGDPDHAGRRPKGHRLPTEARELIWNYVQDRDGDGRIKTNEFSRGTEIGRQLKELNVTPREAADYALTLVGETPHHHDDYYDRERTDTHHEAVQQELRDEQEGTRRRVDDGDDGELFRFLNPRLGDRVVGQDGGQFGGGLRSVGQGTLQIVNGDVVNGAGRVVVGAGDIVGGVLNEAGQLVGVQTAGGQVVMLDGEVLAAPPGGGDGQPLLYQSNGELAPVNGANLGAATAETVNQGFGNPTAADPYGALPAGDSMNFAGAVTPETGSTSTAPNVTPGTPTTTTTAADPTAAMSGAAAAASTTAATGAGVPNSVVAEAKAALQQGFRDPTQPVPGQPEPGKAGPGSSSGPAFPAGNPYDLPRDVVRTVQNILSELTGYSLSLGQTRQFMNQVSPSELSAFLASPVQRLPNVLSTLMHVLMRDHGRPDRVGRDAILAMFDHLLSRRATAQQIFNFFKSLSREQIDVLITFRAEIIGNLPGVPPEVRYAANPKRIEAELTNLQGLRDPAAQLRAMTLERLLAQNAQILHFENAPEGNLAAGQISQVFGNLGEAQHVGLMIPGLNNTMDNFAARAERGQLLQQLATPMARDGVAIVVWLERLGQEVLKQYKSMLSAWQAREQQSRAPMTFQQALAQAARQLAQETVPGMMLRGDARLTFVGHSFGSLIAKESLNQGAKPDACVFLGMPEHRLKKIGARAGCGDVDLYSMVADGDTVDEAVAADEAPEAEAAHAGGMVEEFDRLDPGNDLVPPIEACLDPHDNYGLEGSASLAQMVGVTLGWRPKLLPSEPSIITLYRSSDGTFEDQTESVGWFGPRGEEW